jgi:hypothetical protein
MRAESRRLAPSLLWAAVAEQYMDLALDVMPKRKLSVA